MHEKRRCYTLWCCQYVQSIKKPHRGLLLSSEQKAVVMRLHRCQAFCDKTIHAVEHMFDPKDGGQQKLSGDQINKAYYVISNLSHRLNLDESKTFCNLAASPTKQEVQKGQDMQLIPARVGIHLVKKSSLLQAAVPGAYAVHEIPSTTGACESVRSRFAKVQVSVTADWVASWWMWLSMVCRRVRRRKLHFNLTRNYKTVCVCDHMDCDTN